MLGSVSYTEGNPPYAWIQGEWDLRRVAVSPPPPKPNEKQEPEEEDCGSLRKQLEDYEAYSREQLPLQKKLATDLTETEERLKQFDKKNRPVWEPLDPAGNDSRSLLQRLIDLLRSAKVLKEGLENKDHQALIRKYRIQLDEFGRVIGARIDANINARFYRDAAEACENRKQGQE